MGSKYICFEKSSLIQGLQDRRLDFAVWGFVESGVLWQENGEGDESLGERNGNPMYHSLGTNSKHVRTDVRRNARMMKLRSRVRRQTTPGYKLFDDPVYTN